MIKRLLLFTLMFTLLLATVAPALAQAPVASVNTGSLNVRSGPGLQYGSIATLPYGFGVSLVARNDAANWVFISLTNGVTGWVNVNYLYTSFRIYDLPVNETLAAASLVPTGLVTGASNLNVHRDPALEAEVIRVIPLDQPFELIGRNFNSTWAQIRLSDGLVGWVVSRFVNTSVPVRSVSPTDGSVWSPLPPANSGPRTHLIVAGDTLFTIAQRYGVKHVCACGGEWHHKFQSDLSWSAVGDSVIQNGPRLQRIRLPGPGMKP